jgi:UDP-N-acetyl-D-galactosamine dehydrogenase
MPERASVTVGKALKKGVWSSMNRWCIPAPRAGSARILVMGLTFKVNCPDISNSKVVDLVHELSALASEVVVYDPLADADEVCNTYGIELTAAVPRGPFDAIVLAVRHDDIKRIGAERLRGKLVPHGVLYDLKQVLPIEASDARL